mgnify:CR=1 FL=1
MNLHLIVAIGYIFLLLDLFLFPIFAILEMLGKTKLTDKILSLALVLLAFGLLLIFLPLIPIIFRFLISLLSSSGC